jgi:hypothetical protein
MSTAARQVVATYIDEVWNKGRTELVPQLCAETVVRHDANSVTRLTRAEQIARIDHNYRELQPWFEVVILAGDDRDVTLVWNVTGRDPAWKLCGVEIFRVIDGKISEVWNTPYVDGAWGTAIALWDGEGRTLPVMSAQWDDQAEIVVPLDTRAIAWWLDHLAPGAPALALGVQQADQPPSGFRGTLASMEIGVARSGLVNATLRLNGAAEAPTPMPSAGPPQVLRLAETYGSLRAEDGRDYPVTDGTITLMSGGAASGQVTLRGVPAGAGTLTLGWRHDGSHLEFTMAVHLDTPLRSFVEGDETIATFAWQADTVTTRRTDA